MTEKLYFDKFRNTELLRPSFLNQIISLDAFRAGVKICLHLTNMHTIIVDLLNAGTCSIKIG